MLSHIQKDYADNIKRPFVLQHLHKEAFTPSLKKKEKKATHRIDNFSVEKGK